MKLARAVVVALSAMAAIAPIAFADNMQVDHSGQLLRVKRSKDAHSKAELAEDSAKARSTGVAKRKWKKLHGDQETQSLEAQILEEKAKEEVAASLGFRMPDYIEKSPNLYAFGFVCIGLMIFSGICIHVQLEDKRRWQALQQRYARDRVVSMLWARRSEPDELRSHQAPADASADEISRGSISRPIVSGITKLNSAVGSLSAFISGSNYHNPPPELPKNSGSQDATTASGQTTPRSHSLTSTASVNQPGRLLANEIQSGTVLVAQAQEAIFASVSSWQEIGEILEGEQVLAAGPPEKVDKYIMVPILPRGAIDLKVLEVARRS